MTSILKHIYLMIKDKYRQIISDTSWTHNKAELAQASADNCFPGTRIAQLRFDNVALTIWAKCIETAITTGSVLDINAYSIDLIEEIYVVAR